VISTYTEFLLDGLEAGSDLQIDAKPFQETTQRTARLTRQLLTFSRGGPSTARVIDIDRVFRIMERMLRGLLRENIDLTLKLGGGLVTVDATHLEQILMNLVANASDALPSGGQLRIETSQALVEQCDRSKDGEHPAPGRYALLSIADNGTGMDEATRMRVFEPLFTTKEVSKGTGLGLSTVYGIVKQAGGCIDVESAPKRGTTFDVYLPLAKGVRESLPPAPSLPPRTLEGTETILLVEDDENVRRATERLLASAGYSVLAAKDSSEALLIVEYSKDVIHALVSDVVMPKMSGVDLAKHLVAAHPEMKALFVSGYRSNTLSRDLGFEEDAVLVQKPFSREALLTKLRQLLDS
jgi:CheY-like chemotaxis protein/two-component sensor histidine kinase